MIAEKYVDIYSNSFSMDCLTVRLPNTYGPRACINNPELTFNNFFIGQSLQKKQYSFMEREVKLGIHYM